MLYAFSSSWGTGTCVDSQQHKMLCTWRKQGILCDCTTTCGSWQSFSIVWDNLLSEMLLKNPLGSPLRERGCWPEVQKQIGWKEIRGECIDFFVSQELKMNNRVFPPPPIYFFLISVLCWRFLKCFYSYFTQFKITFMSLIPLIIHDEWVSHMYSVLPLFLHLNSYSYLPNLVAVVWLCVKWN